MLAPAEMASASDDRSNGESGDRRRRPLLLNLLFTCGLIVIALILYVGAYVGMWYLEGAAMLSESVTEPLTLTVFAPLAIYENSDWPGGAQFSELCDSALWAGAAAAE